ncbi:MAG: diguanylate cyclase [Leptospira sp.]|nr:diguanylate cyclase [Leptospira sp.]
MKQHKILIVEDSEIQYRILDRWLVKNGYLTFLATNTEEARKVIAKQSIDVVLLDWELPDGTGIDLINEILQSSSTGWLPIIMVTSHTDSLKIKESIEAGATDFIRKPADEIELLARVFSALRIKALQDLLLESSIRDPLTGLYNRRYMEERIDQEFQRCKRHNRSVAIAMLDIDFFKKVNDSYGHDIGDIVIKRLAHELKSNLRKSDFLSRHGGEEFVVLLPETSVQNAHYVLEKIRVLFSNVDFFAEDGQLFHVSFSGGISGGLLDAKITPNEVLKNADKFLYEAKNSGRNKILTS